MSAVEVLTEIDIVKEHLRAFARQDWEAWRASVMPDVTYEGPAADRMLQGADEVVEGVKMWKVAFPDLTPTVTNTIGCDNQVVAEITWEGTQTGPFAGPMGMIPPSGKRGTVKAAEVCVFEGSKIKKIRVYFDVVNLLRQMGALPGA